MFVESLFWYIISCLTFYSVNKTFLSMSYLLLYRYMNLLWKAVTFAWFGSCFPISDQFPFVTRSSQRSYAGESLQKNTWCLLLELCDFAALWIHVCLLIISNIYFWFTICCLHSGIQADGTVSIWDIGSIVANR